MCPIEKAKSWPFEEARKILRRVQKYGLENVILETGYGPSGLPHIGTFGEVLRTTFVMRAFRRLSDVPAKIIVFSDDMDGFRKVPDNVPNKDVLEKHLERPLTSVPDPFGEYESFAHHNNAMLRRFLDSFGFEYEFRSSTETYKSGGFNDCLTRVLEHFKEIMEIMLPSLREERQKTYSPFLPICQKTGKVLQVPIKEIKLESKSLIYENPETGALEESSVLDGHCKLQWKADWGMRWAAFGVSYEMNGKDLIDSFKLSAKVCEKIGGVSPENMVYELFLDEEGRKISKSKGNGISMNEWLRYAPQESLALYMFQSPQRAKRLYFDVIPNAMDDYIDAAQKFYNDDEERRLDNPVFHIHNGTPLRCECCLKFSMLLNLVQACSTSDETIILQFVKKYVGDVPAESMNLMARMVSYAVIYYNEFIAHTRIPQKPDTLQTQALNALREELLNKNENAAAEELQNAVFSVGKKFFGDDLKRWFETIYGVLFGSKSGPKIGSFISLYGISNTEKLIAKRVSYDQQ